MKLLPWIPWMLLGAMLTGTGCETSPRESPTTSTPALAGAWRSAVRFKTGAFAGIQDLEFMYVFNLGGTMTESSNYDGTPPVPPAYGIWRSLGSNQFEARYEFYTTRAPSRLDEITSGGGWQPSGRGVLVEKMTLSADGQSFVSTLHYEPLDQAGKPIEGGGDADGRGTRIGF